MYRQNNYRDCEKKNTPEISRNIVLNTNRARDLCCTRVKDVKSVRHFYFRIALYANKMFIFISSPFATELIFWTLI